MHPVLTHVVFWVLPLWLAGTALGFPLLSAWNNDHRRIDTGISIERPDPEHDIPGQTILGSPTHRSVTLLNTQSLQQSNPHLTKRWEVPGKQVYRKIRNKLWSAESRRRCMRRKSAELEKRKGTPYPSDPTRAEWQRICSTWESAHADKKSPYIGETLEEGEPERRRRQAARNWEAFNQGMDRSHPGWRESEQRYINWKPGSGNNDLVNDKDDNFNFVDDVQAEGKRLWDGIEQRLDQPPGNSPVDPVHRPKPVFRRRPI